MFRPSLSHLQALMIQIHTKNVLHIVGSPTLTISAAYIHVLIVIHSHCYSLSLIFTTDIVGAGDPTMHSTFFAWICIMRA